MKKSHPFHTVEKYSYTYTFDNQCKTVQIKKKRTTEKCSKMEKVIHIKRIIKQFSGRTGLTIPVVDTSTEPEEVEPDLAQNREGEQDDKIAPSCLDLDAPSHKINVNI
jgi:hypothetical protein